MKTENRKFLDDNYHHWITLRDAFYIRHLDGNTRSNMMRIMAEEFWPGYTSDLWCPTCVADMVKLLYQRYDKWILENPDPASVPEPEKLPAPEAITVAANFPAHSEPLPIVDTTTSSTMFTKKNHKRK